MIFYIIKEILGIRFRIASIHLAEESKWFRRRMSYSSARTIMFYLSFILWLSSSQLFSIWKVHKCVRPTHRVVSYNCIWECTYGFKTIKVLDFTRLKSNISCYGNETTSDPTSDCQQARPPNAINS
jgi:hypothetical protein